ncbi:unnamed protein product, partial [Brachionus calyciflorus]
PVCKSILLFAAGRQRLQVRHPVQSSVSCPYPLESAYQDLKQINVSNKSAVSSFLKQRIYSSRNYKKDEIFFNLIISNDKIHEEFLLMKQLIDFFQIIYEHKRMLIEEFTEIGKNKNFTDFKNNIEEINLFLKSNLVGNEGVVFLKDFDLVDNKVKILLNNLEVFKSDWKSFLDAQDYYKKKENFIFLEKSYFLSAYDVFQKKDTDQILDDLKSKQMQYNNIDIESMKINFENYQKNLKEMNKLRKKQKSNKIKELFELDDELDLLLSNDSFKSNVKFFKIISKKKDLINQLRSSIPETIEDLSYKESYFRTLIKIKESLEKVIFFIDELEIVEVNEFKIESVKQFVEKISLELKSWEEFTLRKKIDNINQKMLDLEKKENEFLNSPGLLSEEKKDYEKIKSLNILIGKEIGNILLYGSKTSKTFFTSEYCIFGFDGKIGGNSGNSNLPTINNIQISADFGKGGRKGATLNGIYRDGFSECRRTLSLLVYNPLITVLTFFNGWVKAPYFTMSSITADDGKKSNQDLEQYFAIKDSSIKVEFEKLKGII